MVKKEAAKPFEHYALHSCDGLPVMKLFKTEREALAWAAAHWHCVQTVSIKGKVKMHKKGGCNGKRPLYIR